MLLVGYKTEQFLGGRVRAHVCPWRKTDTDCETRCSCPVHYGPVGCFGYRQPEAAFEIIIFIGTVQIMSVAEFIPDRVMSLLNCFDSHQYWKQNQKFKMLTSHYLVSDSYTIYIYDILQTTGFQDQIFYFLFLCIYDQIMHL